MCACGWSTETVPTLGMLETAFLEHLVPELTTPVVVDHALG
ncbi:hypothetical protein [Streptomyces sp. MBT27]|nr:hypothetical protein [Streptomyces sp. MBT27]